MSSSSSSSPSSPSSITLPGADLLLSEAEAAALQELQSTATPLFLHLVAALPGQERRS